MKKNIIYLLIAGCSLFLGACNDDDTVSYTHLRAHETMTIPNICHR